MHTAIVERVVDPCAVLRAVGGHHNGAAVLFVGTVREENEGAPVTGLDYSAYASMAEAELAAIALEAAERWSTEDVAIEHRVGTLSLGEASVAIAVGHAHRGEAYEASRYIIEELKRRLPVWKREHYADGRAEWVANAAAGSPPPERP